MGQAVQDLKPLQQAATGLRTAALPQAARPGPRQPSSRDEPERAGRLREAGAPPHRLPYFPESGLSEAQPTTTTCKQGPHRPLDRPIFQ